METQTAVERTTRDRLLEEANAIAEQLRDGGWTVRVARAGEVTPVPPSASRERHGLVYTVPDDVADIPGFLKCGSFDQYETYRHVSSATLSLVTQLSDPETKRAVVLVGTVDRDRARPLAREARQRGELHSHVRLLDGTVLATFRHERPAHFFTEEP